MTLLSSAFSFLPKNNGGYRLFNFRRNRTGYSLEGAILTIITKPRRRADKDHYFRVAVGTLTVIEVSTHPGIIAYC